MYWGIPPEINVFGWLRPWMPLKPSPAAVICSAHVLDQLSLLVDKSLVVADNTESRTRPVRGNLSSGRKEGHVPLNPRQGAEGWGQLISAVRTPLVPKRPLTVPGPAAGTRITRHTTGHTG